MTSQIEIGLSKRGQRAYSLDEVAVVPSRRTRDPQDVSITWQIDAYTLDIPVLGAPMDSVMSPATAIELGRLGGLGVLNLEGLWTRYEDPQPVLDEIAALHGRRSDPAVIARLQQLYDAPIRPELIASRLAEPMRRDCADLTEATVASGHWMAQEKPDAVNAAVARLLATRLPGVWPKP